MKPTRTLIVTVLMMFICITGPYAGDLEPTSLRGPLMDGFTQVANPLQEIYTLIQDTKTLAADTNTKVTSGTSECTRLIAPYGTGADNPIFWTGLGITNYNLEEEAPCTITLYDGSGGSGTMEITIPRQGIFSATMGQIVHDPKFVDGDTPLDPSLDLWIVVESDKRIDGIVFLGDTAVTLLHGYLFRKSDCSQ